MLLFAAGCSSNPPNTSSRLEQSRYVSLGELEQETKHLVFISFVGSDDKFHYFVTPERKQYKVDVSAAQLIPANQEVLQLGQFSLFVRIKDGKVTVPDAAEMSKLPPEYIEQATMD
jgi:hypothetical protein